VFEKALAEKLQKIFQIKKVSFDEISDSQEQECLFVEIESAKNSIKGGEEKSMVTGNCVIFGNAEKMRFGFFSKAIQEADPADTKDFFFFDFEVNTRRYQNIVQRGLSFIYFYKAQYDPDTGEITSVDFNEEIT
jgi:hypothetical protein